MDLVFLPGTIRDRIKDLMKSTKMTQAELAVRIGTAERTLSRFLRGWGEGPEGVSFCSRDTLSVTADAVPAPPEGEPGRGQTLPSGGVFHASI